MKDVYIALLHYPVYDKNGKIVSTAVTNVDIHDIARSARTYQLAKFFLVTPVDQQIELIQDLVSHWTTGVGAEHNPKRKEALKLVAVAKCLEEVINQIKKLSGAKPLLMATSARPGPGRISFAQARSLICNSHAPFLIILGTGWGLEAGFIKQMDYRLEPIFGRGDYNHLSVRSAAAIILDRLLATQR